MSRLYSTIAALAVFAGTSIGYAQAETVWRFPFKGSPYAVEAGKSAREIIKPNLSKAAVRQRKLNKSRPAR